MITVEVYLENHGVPKSIVTQERFADVFNQAKRHTRRDATASLLEEQRPNESDRVRDYRLQIARHLTQEGVKKYINKVGRIFRSVSILEMTDISDVTKEYLEEKPFYYAGRFLSLEDYFFSCIMQQSLEDPNAFLIAFPVNEENPLVNPAAAIDEGGLSASESIGIQNLVIPSEFITEDTKDIFAYQAGIRILQRGETEVKAPYYMIADAESWYVLEPIRFDKAGSVVYEQVLWYTHASGVRPGLKLPGDAKLFDAEYTYNESFIWSYYEYADEFVTSFSDNQAVRVRHAYPKTIIDEIPCPNNCIDGKVEYTTKKGERDIKQCDTCKGAGHIRNIDPYDTLVRPQKTLGENRDTTPVLEYVSPDVAMLDVSYSVSFDLLMKGKRAIGLDLLENVTESGIAKEYRLEDLQDQLKVVGDAFSDMIESYLWQVESLLVVNDTSRQSITVTRPEQYTVKNSLMLLEEAKDAMQSDRIQRSMQYYNVTYRGDNVILKVFQLSHAYAALYGVQGEELKVRIATAYDESDLIKADRAFWAFKTLSQTEKNFMIADEEDLFKKADELITPYLPLSAVPLAESDVDGNGGQVIAEGQIVATGEEQFVLGQVNQKLLETVGGVTGIIEISKAVAEGKMTEPAAEEILIQIYGLPKETAAALIEIPPKTVEAALTPPPPVAKTV